MGAIIVLQLDMLKIKYVMKIVMFILPEQTSASKRFVPRSG